MKKIAVLFTALTLTVSAFAQKKADEVATFKTETIDMGKIKQDVPSTAVFEVTNISKEPLIIEQANPTCGCTIGDYTKEPIAPGKTGFIKATYNAKNLNSFEKHLTVKFAGTDDMKSITIKGQVLSAEDFSKEAPAAPAAAAAVEDKMKEEAVPAKKAGTRTVNKTKSAAKKTLKP